MTIRRVNSAFQLVPLVAVDGVITPNADQGNLFRHIATGNVTLASPINGDNAQVLEVQVFASGAARTLTAAGVTVSIAEGACWWGRYSYDSTTAQWILDDGTGVPGSTGGGLDVEAVRDAMGVALVAGANVTITPNDGADTITIAAATTGASGIPASTVDARGDLIAGTANDTVARLPVSGVNGRALVENSTASTGLAWAAPTPAAHGHAASDITSGTLGIARIPTGTTGSTVSLGDHTHSGGGSSGYATVQDEGSSLTQRAILNFTGAGVTVSDNSGASRTTVNIPGGGSSSTGVPTVINVKSDYGALGNGSTNDATAIQNAINAAEAAGGGRVYFPAGTYNVGTTIVVDNDMVHLVGAGMGVTTLAKTGNFDLLRIAGTAGTGGHTTSCSVRDMMLLGNDFTGRLLDVIYGTRHTFDNLHLFANLGIGIDMVELWDSRFTNCYVEWCSGNSTSEPGIYVRSSRASSGTGSSTDSTNQVYFVGCLVETWRGGAIRVEQGTGSPENIYSIHFYNTKIETDLIRGSAITVGTGASNVSFVDTYCFMGSFDSGFSTPVDAISLGGNGQVTVDGCYIGAGGTVLASGVNASGGGIRLNNITGYYSDGPPTSGSHIRFTGGSNYTLGHVISTGATNLVSGLSTSVQANSINPIRAVAGAVSDGSFPAVPPIGTQAVDTNNNRLYVKTASGTWRYATLT